MAIVAGGSVSESVVRFSLNVSGLEQTGGFLPNKMVWFHLDAKSSHAGARKPQGSTPESEADSNPKRNLRPPRGENLRRIP